MAKKMTIVEQYEEIVAKYGEVMTEDEIAFLKELSVSRNISFSFA